MADWYAALSALPGSYQLHVQAVETTLRAGLNNSDVVVSAWIEKTAGSGYFTGGGGATFSATVDGSPVASGAWSPYDFTSYTAKLLFSTTATVTHNANGTKSVTVAVSVNDPYNMGTAGVSQSLTLTTLVQAPGIPTSLACSYVSDTQASLAWANNYATNGVPTQNTIQASVNGGAFADLVTISATTAANVGTAANRKTVFKVLASNGAGASAYSGTATLFTTPGAPTGVSAAKTGSDIVIGWTPTVAFSEHQHVVEASYSTDAGTTWSAFAPSAASPIAAGTSTATDVAPDPAKLWRYSVKARNTDVGALASAGVVSNTVQLLAPPLKPTIPTVPAYADKAAAFRFPWVHNSVDTTAQTKFQTRYSTNGGGSWTTSAKTTSATPHFDFPASTWAANTAAMFQVRTKGTYDSGADGDASYSPWSDSVTVTFKTRPTATITTPADSSVYAQAALVVALGFAQAEAATFVSATIELYDGATLLKQKLSTTLASTDMEYPLTNGGAYSLQVSVLDSNGVRSSTVTSTFTVAFTPPPAALLVLDYLDDSGIGQVGIVIPAPGVGEVSAVAVTVTRTIGATTEVVIAAAPATSLMTILDATPTIYGDNVYTVTTITGDGATTDSVGTLTTTEEQWAFLSKGDGYSNIIRLAGSAQPQSAIEVESRLIRTEGRKLAVGLYGDGVSVAESGTAEIITGVTSSREELTEWLKIPGKACFRDPSGLRMFGRVRVSRIEMDTIVHGTVDYVIEATS